MMKKITDYIICFDNILDNKICEDIIKSSEDETFQSAGTGETELKNDYRKCYDKPLGKKFDNVLFNATGEVIKRYEKIHPWFHSGSTIQDTGYVHLLYKGSQEGEYKIHVDHFDLYPRILSISFILNDDYDGGDFVFFEEGSYTVKKKKGAAVVFPSNFCFPHAVLPVKNGDRHSIITWIN